MSPIICQEELRSLVEKRDKHENMQITVHLSTREVLATYSIDEARMECSVTLPVNHPLGVVKVDSGKQIGGKFLVLLSHSCDQTYLLCCVLLLVR